MSNGFSIPEAAALIENLRKARTRFEARAADLETELRKRELSLKRTIDNQLKDLEASTGEKRVRMTAEHERALQGHLQYAEKRGARLVEGYSSAKRKRAKEVEQKEDRRKYLVQKGTLDTEKWRDSQVARIEEEYRLLQEEIDNEQRWLSHWRSKAQKVFRGFQGLLNAQADQARELKPARELLEAGRAALGRVGPAIGKLSFLPWVAHFLPWFLLVAGLGAVVVFQGERNAARLGELALRGLVVVAMCYGAGFSLARWRGKTVGVDLANAGSWLQAASERAFAEYQAELEKAKSTAREKLQGLNDEWENAIGERAGSQEQVESELHEQYKQLLGRHQARASGRSSELQRKFQAAQEALETEYAKTREDVLREQERRLTEFRAEHAQALETSRSEFTAETAHLYQAVEKGIGWLLTLPGAEEKLAGPQFKTTSQSEVLIGRFRASDAALQGFEQAEVPLVLGFPKYGSLVLESTNDGRERAVAVLNNLVLNLLASIAPGKAHFTFFDPVALGQSFPGIMHLADFEENLVNRRIWTEPGEIEQRLVEINAHMEKVIQMYLRNEFPDLLAYNQAAGRIAEKYHFIVIADFPANFTESALRRLHKIVQAGASCGVYLLMHKEKKAAPAVGEVDGVLAGIPRIELTTRKAAVPLAEGRELVVQLDVPPAAEVVTRFLKALGEASRGSNVVQVPFSQVAPAEHQVWSGSTTEEVRVAIGRSGATKLQQLRLGQGTRQHVLIAGKTGSGKSTLLHVLITNLALWCSPNEVEFYLIDFKKGVEFKDYATHRLPHAKVVAIESDRQFGLSVLNRVDEELRERGELFRKHGVQDLPGFRKALPGKSMPRVLLIVDEFQELFVQEDSIAHTAAMLLDRIVRQGRAFGIHVILGSQTLGGAYSIARSTMAQMVVRIALQCSEADSFLIMDENNPAPRLLSRPGEGIYNDSGGLTEANSPFQTVWLPEYERRESLQRIAARAGEGSGSPLVFEGNAPADIRDNRALSSVLEGRPETIALPPRVWLGLPNEIKGPTEVVLPREASSNLLIVGRARETIETMLRVALLTLARMDSRAEFVVLDPAGPNGAVGSLARVLSRPAKVLKMPEIGEELKRLTQELVQREQGHSASSIYVVVTDLAGFKQLRPEDEFSVSYGEAAGPAADFQKLLMEGAAAGIHLLLAADSYTTASRFLGRKGLKEFRYRVLFQMSAQDSTSLTDDPRANELGLYRAVLYDENEGRFELFRPYAPPSVEWVEWALKTGDSGPLR